MELNEFRGLRLLFSVVLCLLWGNIYVPNFITVLDLIERILWVILKLCAVGFAHRILKRKFPAGIGVKRLVWNCLADTALYFAVCGLILLLFGILYIFGIKILLILSLQSGNPFVS